MSEIFENLAKFARTICDQPLQWVLHRPEPTARHRLCFSNVGDKIQCAGGKGQLGWTFQKCHKNSVGGYLVATHHALWRSPDGILIDITPYPDENTHPLSSGDEILFLADDKAKPVAKPNLIAPLPMKYFALDGTPALAEYVAELQHQENARCDALGFHPNQCPTIFPGVA